MCVGPVKDGPMLGSFKFHAWQVFVGQGLRCCWKWATYGRARRAAPAALAIVRLH